MVKAYKLRDSNEQQLIEELNKTKVLLLPGRVIQSKSWKGCHIHSSQAHQNKRTPKGYSPYSHPHQYEKKAI